jgi:hypothetical protein
VRWFWSKALASVLTYRSLGSLLFADAFTVELVPELTGAEFLVGITTRMHELLRWGGGGGGGGGGEGEGEALFLSETGGFTVL